MQSFVYRRLLLIVPTLFGITLVVFSAVRFLPGDMVDQLTGAFGAASPQLRQQLRDEYKLNNSIPSQYASWMGNLLQGDFGTSIVSGRPVTSDLRQRLPITAELGLLALLISQLVAIPIGVLSALKQDSIWDYASRSLAIGFLAIPSFWMALLVLTYGFRWFGWTPPLQYKNLWENPISNLKTIWVPAVLLGAASSGSVMRLTRSMMLEVLRQDYVRTAAAKGLQQRTIIVRHALRNAMLPIVTVIGLQIPALVGGTVILETIFSIPGMGSLLLNSVSTRDYPVVQAIVLITATVVILSNLAVDITYSMLDPRLRVS